jgi:hypothetical protein
MYLYLEINHEYTKEQYLSGLSLYERKSYQASSSAIWKLPPAGGKGRGINNLQKTEVTRKTHNGQRNE